MTHPSDDVLVGLVTGEPTERAVAEHLATCPTCQQTVAEVRQVEALLGEPRTTVAWDHPSEDLWLRISQEVTDRTARDVGEDATGESGTGDAGAATTPALVVPLAARRRGVIATLVAAAACLAIGVGIGRWVLPDSPDPGVVTASGPAIQLTTLTGAAPMGSAQLVRAADGSAEVRVVTEPFPRGAGFIEVWLINIDGQRMISIGALGPSQSASFTVPDGALAAGYRVLDISREEFDAKPEHSGDSVMRGTLPA